MKEEEIREKKPEIKRRDPSPDVRTRFENVFSYRAYYAVCKGCLNIAEGLYVIGSVNWAIQNVSEVQPSDFADLDLAIDTDSSKAETVRVSIESELKEAYPDSTILVEFLPEKNIPRLEIFINGKRVVEVNFLHDASEKITLTRQKLKQDDLVSKTPVDNFLTSQRLYLEASATRVATDGERVTATEIIELASETRPDQRILNPFSLYTEKNIAKLAKMAESPSELLQVYQFYKYIRVSFYRALCKLAEWRHIIDNRMFSHVSNLRTSPFDTNETWAIISRRASDLDCGESLVPEFYHQMVLIATYLIRAILAFPEATLAKFAVFPALAPFQPIRKPGDDRLSLLSSFGWFGTSGINPHAPALGDQGTFPGYIFEKVLVQAGSTIREVRPKSLYEIIAILIVYTGAHNEEDIRNIVNSIVKWPEALPSLPSQSKYAREVDFDPSFKEREREETVRLALTLARKVHHEELTDDPNNTYVESDFVILEDDQYKIVEKGKEEKSRDMPPSDRYAFAYLLTRIPTVEHFVRDTIIETIHTMREE